ncbi:hypothetical protein BGZ99_000716 [Dissophora globulifera]|uniref:Kinesin motor domain-containing protein n=1 Tax=Dissophora globulifera TaxID=979702 RepID=A0A9P6UL95_9FUNG|nr:hypothetical protein BGZ99_000716 [Dissophora globulifera]
MAKHGKQAWHVKSGKKRVVVPITSQQSSAKSTRSWVAPGPSSSFSASSVAPTTTSTFTLNATSTQVYSVHTTPPKSAQHRANLGLPSFRIKSSPSPVKTRLYSPATDPRWTCAVSPKKPVIKNSRLSLSDLVLASSSVSDTSEDSSDTIENDVSMMASHAVEPETQAPDMETQAPDMETQAPDMETQAPDMETQAPDMETQAPDMDTVKTFLRLRPSVNKAGQDGYVTILDDNSIVMTPPPNSRSKKVTKHTFSKVFQPSASQADVFKETCMPLLTSVLKQSKSSGLIFAYGVSNSGKTHSILGSDQPKDAGILPRALKVIFKSIQDLAQDSEESFLYRPVGFQDVERIDSMSWNSTHYGSSEENDRGASLDSVTSLDSDLETLAQKLNIQFEDDLVVDNNTADINDQVVSLPCGMDYSVWVSCAEVYLEKIYDLLAEPPKSPIPLLGPMDTKRPSLTLKTDASTGQKYVHGQKEIKVKTVDEALLVLRAGLRQRQVFTTLLNKASSRSHCIFTIKILRTPHFGNDAAETAARGKTSVSRLSIVDLAGSERIRNTNSSGQRRKEAGDINNSLMVLGHCMEILRWNQLHPKKNQQVVPYNHSKLTLLFQSVLEGHAKDSTVCVIVNVNPFQNDFEETIQTLRFSSVAMEVSPAQQMSSKYDRRITQEAVSPARQDQIIADSSVSSNATSLTVKSDGQEEPTEDDGMLLATLQSQVEDLYQKLEAEQTRYHSMETELRSEFMDKLTDRILKALTVKDTDTRSTSPIPFQLDRTDQSVQVDITPEPMATPFSETLSASIDQDAIATSTVDPMDECLETSIPNAQKGASFIHLLTESLSEEEGAVGTVELKDERTRQNVPETEDETLPQSTSLQSSFQDAGVLSTMDSVAEGNVLLERALAESEKQRVALQQALEQANASLQAWQSWFAGAPGIANLGSHTKPLGSIPVLSLTSALANPIVSNSPKTVDITDHTASQTAMDFSISRTSPAIQTENVTSSPSISTSDAYTMTLERSESPRGPDTVDQEDGHNSQSIPSWKSSDESLLDTLEIPDVQANQNLEVKQAVQSEQDFEIEQDAQFEQALEVEQNLQVEDDFEIEQDVQTEHGFEVIQDLDDEQALDDEQHLGDEPLSEVEQDLNNEQPMDDEQDFDSEHGLDSEHDLEFGRDSESEQITVSSSASKALPKDDRSQLHPGIVIEIPPLVPRRREVFVEEAPAAAISASPPGTISLDSSDSSLIDVSTSIPSSARNTGRSATPTIALDRSPTTTVTIDRSPTAISITDTSPSFGRSMSRLSLTGPHTFQSILEGWPSTSGLSSARIGSGSPTSTTPSLRSQTVATSLGRSPTVLSDMDNSPSFARSLRRLSPTRPIPYHTTAESRASSPPPAKRPRTSISATLPNPLVEGDRRSGSHSSSSDEDSGHASGSVVSATDAAQEKESSLQDDHDEYGEDAWADDEKGVLHRTPDNTRHRFTPEVQEHIEDNTEDFPSPTIPAQPLFHPLPVLAQKNGSDHTVKQERPLTSLQASAFDLSNPFLDDDSSDLPSEDEYFVMTPTPKKESASQKSAPEEDQVVVVESRSSSPPVGRDDDDARSEEAEAYFGHGSLLLGRGRSSPSEAAPRMASSTLLRFNMPIKKAPSHIESAGVRATKEEEDDVMMTPGRKRKRKLRTKKAVFEEDMEETVGVPPPTPSRGGRKPNVRR